MLSTGHRDEAPRRSRILACPGVSGCIRCPPRGYLVRGAASSFVCSLTTPRIGVTAAHAQNQFLALRSRGKADPDTTTQLPARSRIQRGF